MEITVIWDTVNTAARLESMTRELKQWILISQSTYNSFKNKRGITFEDLWYREIRWKQKTIKIYWVKK